MGLSLRDIPGLRRDLLAVAVLSLAGGLAMGSTGPVLPMYLDAVGIDVRVIGLLFSVHAIAVAISEVSWGWAMDRLHFKLPLVTGTLGLAVVLLAFTLPFAQSLPILFLLFFLRGCTLVATVPASRAFVGSTIGTHQKALFLGLFSTILGAGRALGAFNGGYVAKELGYQAVFVVTAAMALAGGVIGLPLLRAKRLTHYSDQSASAADTTSPLKHDNPETASFKAQGLIALLTFVPIGVTSTFIPLLAKKVILLTPSDVGMVYFISGLIGMALTVPMGRLSDRYGRRLFMATGLATITVALVGVAYASSFDALLLFAVLNAIGMSIYGPAALALFSNSVSAAKQGTAMGLYGLCEDLGIIIGPAVGGILWEGFGPQPTFWFGAAATVIGAVVSLSAIRRPSLQKRLASS